MKNILVLGWLLAAASVCGQSLSDDTLRKVSFDQNLGAKVSLNVPFHDETGRTVSLGDFFGKRPVVLVLGYYGCPMLCTLVLNGMISGLQDVPLQIGRDYEVVSVSIDPHETFALASAKKQNYVSRFGQPGAATGWHFLTGDEPSIHQLAREVGFNYFYDQASRQYAHPSGLVILTAEGKISRYFSGVVFSAAGLTKALGDASRKKVGSPVEQWFLLCFHYSPLTGRYSQVILTVVRAFSAAILLALAGFIFLGWRRAKRTGT